MTRVSEDEKLAVVPPPDPQPIDAEVVMSRKYNCKLFASPGIFGLFWTLTSESSSLVSKLTCVKHVTIFVTFTANNSPVNR